MLPLEEAQARLLARIPPPAVETLTLRETCGRYAAAPIRALLDLPAFDNSSMDGFAVRAADLAQASAVSPLKLRLAGRVTAGEHAATAVARGTCVRVFTGSALPADADAVVMQEDTRNDPTDANAIAFLDAPRVGENIRVRGSDVRAGAALITPGDRITATRLALLAAAGVKELPVARRPVLGLLATGTELREAGEPLQPGQIYESNRSMLAALADAAGAEPVAFPIVADDLRATQIALEAAFARCDLVITSGGVSVGEHDFVKAAFEQMGGRLDFWRVAVKPGKPFVGGTRGDKALFGLPGNPVSAFVTFLLLVRPVLLRWQGATDVALPAQNGVLAEPLANRGDRRHFMRVCVDAGGRVRSAGHQASHALLSLAASNGLLDVPPETTLAAGSPVRVLRWDL